MKKLGKAAIAFMLIMGAYLLYAGLFIFRTSFVVAGERYFCLLDDAMISMRYARNLANGNGLVWNPGGERVEGYTNFLWVLYMSLFHLLPIAQSKVSLFMQISGALFLTANLFFVWKIADQISDHSALVSISAVFLTAFYHPLNIWGLGGMEVSALAVITNMCIWEALRCIKSTEFSVRLYVILALGMLIRMDIGIVFLGILVFLSIADPKNRKAHLMFGLGAFLLSFLLQTLFRIWYYGEILPNTYYLKMTGYPLLLRMSRGFAATLRFVLVMSWFFLLALASLTFRRDRAIMLLFWVFVVQVVYDIYIGGDAWETVVGSNRFLSIVMPVFLILVSYGLVRTALLLMNHFGEKTVGFALVVLVFATLIGLNNFYVEGSKPTSLEEWALVETPTELAFTGRCARKGLLLKRISTADAKIAVTAAGAISYFADRYAIDILGKNDLRVARLPMRVPTGLRRFVGFSPGHLKWDYGYSIGQLKPDIVAGWTYEEAKPYLDTDYVWADLGGQSVYLLKGSSNIAWDEVARFR